MASLQTDLQRELNRLRQVGGPIELYTLDATNIGGIVYRFTNYQSPSGGPVIYNGQSYTSLPIVGSGFDITSTGTLPTPSLTVSNVSKVLLNAVVTLGDLVGATVERRLTHTRFLDSANFTDRWNLLESSETSGTGNSESSSWLKVRLTSTPDSAMAPDGTYTASRLAENGTTQPGSPFYHITQQRPTAATTNTFSVFLKAQQRTFANVRFDDGAGVNTCTVSINLNTGALGSIVNAGNVTSSSATVENLGDGWYRLRVTATWSAITTCRVFIRSAVGLGTTATDLGHVPDTNAGFLWWGAQLIQGSEARPYQPTGRGTGSTSSAYGTPSFVAQPYANTSAFRLEKWVVDQKTEHTSELITWRLATALDRLGLRFGRQVLKNVSAKNLYAPGVARSRIG